MAQNGAKIKFLTFFKQSVDGTFVILFGKATCNRRLKIHSRVVREKPYIRIFGQYGVQSEFLSVTVN